jgi:hypothetical protein
MKWIWIPFVIFGSGLSLVGILRPSACLKHGQELTDSKREKIRDQGIIILGSCALIAWPGLSSSENFPYVFGPIGLLWLIENFKTINKDLLSALLAVTVLLWMVLSLVFRHSN